jgi:tripartite-type tricarboxylate transporter receptor subunit TctC
MFKKILIICSFLLISPHLLAQNYPNKPIRFVIPFPPGGATDIIGRIISMELTKTLGQQVVADNRGGSSGNIGADIVAKSPNDGYTLLMGAMTSHAINASLEKATIRYDLEKDLIPISVVGVVPMVIVVNPKLPVYNLKDFISYAKANPGRVTFASSGAGAPQRLAMEMLKNMTQIDILHVPYRGSGPAMTDLVGGQVLSMSETLPACQQFIESKQLRPLAVTTASRLKPIPEVPTISEALGIPNFDVVSMFGVMAPSGTPPSIIQRISDDLKTILQKPDVQERMMAAGVFVNYMNPKDSSTKLHQEVAMWGKVISESHVTSD